LFELATRQHGVVGRWQLIELGFGVDAIEARIASRRLQRVHREAYAVGHGRLSQHGHWSAAALAYGQDALLSHRSAAALWGLAADRGPVDVTAGLGRQGVRRRAGIFLHRCKIEPDEKTVHTGIWATTVARTVFDLAEVGDRSLLERAWEEADRLGLLLIGDIERACERGRGRRALRPIRRLLSDARAPEIRRSSLEDRFARFCDEHRLPPRLTNVLVLGREVDVYWPSARLVVELDGFAFHGHRAAFERDRARDIDLLVEGIRVIRITHRRLDEEAGVVAAKLGALLTAS
jgi:very-short-patch-repair endonuclease